MRTSLPLSALIAAAFASGCMKEPLYAPVGSLVSVNPATVELATSPVYRSEDNVGNVIIVDATVLGPTGIPLENTLVEANTPGAGIFLLPEAAVQYVDFPEAPDDVAAAQAEDCYNDDGVRDASENEWCAWYYDQETDSFYQFADEYADAGGYQPNYAKLATDGMGIARVFMFIDQMPYDSAEADAAQGDLSVLFSIRVHSVSLAVQTVGG
jgi:hypothetical protein